jgi:hypothetical protein
MRDAREHLRVSRVNRRQEIEMIDWDAPTRHKHPGTRRALAAYVAMAGFSLLMWTGVTAILTWIG